MQLLEIENAPFVISNAADGLEVTHGMFVAKKEIYRGPEQITIRRPDGYEVRIEVVAPTP